MKGIFEIMNKQHSRLTVFLLTFSVLTALMLPLSAALPTLGDAGLYDGVIRLHVIANSDSEDDQSLKLKVRDGILTMLRELLADAESKEDAKAIITENLSVIEDAAKAVLTESGSSYTAKASLTKEDYPTRRYGGISLPAGCYTSLRIQIGEAEGQNWWCMIFPTLCVGAKTEDVYIAASDEELVAAGLTPSQVRIITGNTPDVKIKFRILEFFGGIFS